MVRGTRRQVKRIKRDKYSQAVYDHYNLIRNSNRPIMECIRATADHFGMQRVLCAELLGLEDYFIRHSVPADLKDVK